MKKNIFSLEIPETLLIKKARMQRDALAILSERRHEYRVSVHTGIVYIRKNFPLEEEYPPFYDGKVWRYLLKGYTGPSVSIPAHVLIWLVAYGEFDPKSIIRHRDKDPKNNAIDNLYIKNDVEQLREVLDATPVPKGAKKNGNLKLKNARYEEILKIKKIKNAKPKITNQEISEILNVKLSAVKKVTNAMKTGKALKYERPGPYPSPNSLTEKWKNESMSDL